MIRFTAQEKRVIDLLGDGAPHSLDEIMEKCLWDELSDKLSIMMTICRIRRKLKPYGQYIHCIPGVNGRKTQYIHLCARNHTSVVRGKNLNARK